MCCLSATQLYVLTIDHVLYMINPFLLFSSCDCREDDFYRQQNGSYEAPSGVLEVGVS